MKNILFIIAIFFTATTAFGQTAKELLDKVKNKYNTLNTYYIKFDFEVGKEKSTGQVFTQKQKYNLDVMGINQIYDGKKLYTISKDEKEVTVSNSNSIEDIMTPTKILNSYGADFTYEFEKTQKINDKNIRFIKFTPKSKNTIKYALLGIDTNNNQIYQYKEFGNNNTTTTITVKEYLENLIILKSYFNFDQNKYKAKGYIVTQL